jgi:Fic family protein
MVTARRGAAAATPAQRYLRLGLKDLHRMQSAGKSVIRTGEIERKRREAVVSNGFLTPIISGWYMSTQPGIENGNTTPWTASMLEFVARYAGNRFGRKWCIDAGNSLKFLTGTNLLPRQITIHAPRANNSVLALPAGFSLFALKSMEPLPTQYITTTRELQVYTLPYALAKVPEAFFRTSRQDALLALRALQDASDLNRILLDNRLIAQAGRLAGALRAIGRPDVADDIAGTMKVAGYRLGEVNPLDGPIVVAPYQRAVSPYVDRISLMWAAMREPVLRAFEHTKAPSLPKTVAEMDAGMQKIEDNYVSDAYHSLSIEGYRVSEDLIRRVASGDWNPLDHGDDATQRNAMAARGYYLAHIEVKKTIRALWERPAANAGEAVAASSGLRAWYRELFSPSVDAGILTAGDLAGYRDHQVYVKNAIHVPPPKEAVREAMPALFDLLKAEPDPTVRAVLGHFVLVFIHPYMDGNGRLGRFLMNVMLCAAGYPWTIVTIEKRAQYLEALNAASGGGDIAPFAQFIASLLSRTDA